MSADVSVNFLPPIIHLADQCNGVVKIESLGLTSEKKLRAQGHCSTCDKYLYYDLILTDLINQCPSPINSVTTVQTVPSSLQLNSQDNEFLKARGIAID